VRAVLALSVVLLALTVVIERDLLPGPSARPGADRALAIVVGAKGPLLPAGFLGGGGERVGEVIRLGERTLVAPSPVDGLRSALLDAQGALVSQRAYAIGSRAEEVRALMDTVASAPAGALLVLASSGRLVPPDGAGTAGLALVLDELGARARPGTHTPESWALIALRRERGWEPLAEGYSVDSGVALAYVLGADVERERSGDAVLVRAPAQHEVFLDQELAHAALRSPGVELAPDARVGGRRLAAILQPALEPAPEVGGEGAPSSILWREVHLGASSGFLCWLGLSDDAAPGSDGVRFQLRIDGELVREVAVAPGTPWRTLLVDLRPFAERTVELELRIEPGASARGDAALWGRPMLVHGYTRSPLEVWAAAR